MPDAVDVTLVLRILLKAAGYGAALVAAGLALFVVVHRQDPAGEDATRRLAAAAGAAGLVLVAALLATEMLYLVGWSVADALDPDLLAVVLDTAMGDALALRAAGLAAVLLLALGPRVRWTAAAGALAIAGSFALVGHSLRDPRPVLATLVFLHVMGVAYWIGAFAPLHRATRHGETAAAGRLAEAFGRNAVAVVGVLTAAGAGMLLVLTAGQEALLATAWGLALVVKILLVSGILAFAAMNKLRLSPALAAGDAEAGAALRRSIAAEAALVALVLVATSTMTTLGLAGPS
jgi:putative copper resistance protein D